MIQVMDDGNVDHDNEHVRNADTVRWDADPTADLDVTFDDPDVKGLVRGCGRNCRELILPCMDHPQGKPLKYTTAVTKNGKTKTRDPIIIWK